MATYGRLFATLIALVVISMRIGNATDLSENASGVDKVEGRLQTYDSYWYNDVYYWWPWFSDLATVIMIKIKIAIGLAAIYAFGDGYYWTKSKEVSHVEAPNFLDKFKWASSEPHSAPCFNFKFWGRRKRDLSGNYEEEEEDQNYLEYFFDLFEINNEDCRKLVVCEMDFEASGDAKLSSSLSFKHDLFEKYRGTVPQFKSDCQRMYSKCRLRTNQDQDIDNSIE